MIGSKIILVPPAFHASMVYQNAQKPAMVYDNQTNLTVHDRRVMVDDYTVHQQYHDPLLLYYNWFGGMTGRVKDRPYNLIHRFSDSELQYHFWDRQPIMDWIEQNCRQQVLIEAMDSMWTFLFLDGTERRSEFMQFVQMSKRETEFIVRTAVMTDIEPWLGENVRGGHTVARGGIATHIHIRDVEEAIHFKLRWSEDFITK